MTKINWDAVWINASLITCAKDNQIVENGAIAVSDGKIAWLGRMQDLPEYTSTHVYDVGGKCLTPGLIDCHTHLVFAGNRANEFKRRLHGASYEDIAREGGGIQSTVMATRLATEEQLFNDSVWRARALMTNGITTLEIKSGYGLDLATELKMLRVAKRIAKTLPIRIKTTFLGAHCVPPEYKDNSDAYVDLVCDQMIPEVAKWQLADAVDVFCENIAFSLAQTERVFLAAKKHQLTVKCHAEQLSTSGAAQLAATYQALSADHLEYATEDTVKTMAEKGTVAVLLPGAYYFLREKTLPPIALLRQYAVPMALATDCNPGTSPMLSLLLMMNMACTLYRMTPEEALMGVTRHAATALGLDHEIGSLEVGKQADFAIWQIHSAVELAYYAGWNPLHQLVIAGNLLIS